MKELISYSEARADVLSLAKRMPPESLGLEVSVNRIAAEDIKSTTSIPPFDNSAMDGFAVRAGDIGEPPAVLNVIEDIPAGASPTKKLIAGTCARIMTGALVPKGATAVVPIEWTEEIAPGEITIRKAPADGQHIRLSGADVNAGDVVVAAGDRITPARLGLLAAAGVDRVPLSARPLVAVVATGDELVEVSEELTPGKIRNSNGPTLAAQVRSAGGTVLGPLVARDSREAVEQTIQEIIGADILVFAGGVSVGDYDFVQESLERRGMNTIFWRVKQRPGKPLLVGELAGKPVIGLPGNPVSASVCFEMYIRPLIERYLGAAPQIPLIARLAEAVDKRPGLHYFARGILFAEGGSLHVRLAGPQASNIFSTMAKANCIVHLPEANDHLSKGAEVNVSLLPWTNFIAL